MFWASQTIENEILDPKQNLFVSDVVKQFWILHW